MSTTAAHDDHIKHLLGMLGPRGKLNSDHPELQDALNDKVDWFCEYISRKSRSVPRFGMLSQLAARIPIYVYDLPYLARRVSTAFTDYNRIYINARFMPTLERDTEVVTEAVRKFIDGKGGVSDDVVFDLLCFVIAHEVEHCRRKHDSRMLDLPIANMAMDARINGDILVTMCIEILKEGVVPIPHDPLPLVSELMDVINGASLLIPNFVGTSSEKIVRWFGVSEEQIGAEMMKEMPDEEVPEAKDQQTIDFNALCEAVLLDLAEIGGLATQPQFAALGNATRYAATEKLVQEIKRAKGQLPEDKKANLQNELSFVLMQPEVGACSEQRSTGDAYIDGLTASNRVEMMLMLLEMVAKNEATPGDGVTVKNMRDAGFNGEQNEHEMSAEEFKDILDDQVPGLAEKLGYDDIIAQNKMTGAIVTQAVNQAAADAAAMGGNYPGEHMVDYAIKQRAKLYQPKITWITELKDLVMNSGSTYEKDPFTPTNASISAMNCPSEFGYASIDDVVMEPSYVQMDRERSLILVIVDTSGSTNMVIAEGKTAIQTFASETVNMAKESDETPFAPEVVMFPADTICRGEPIEINADNVDSYLNDGVEMGGDGGTNLTAAIQSVLTWFHPGGRYEGRKIDGIVFFTDSYDTPPKESAIKSYLGDMDFPNILWVVPDVCHQDHFERSVSKYSRYVPFSSSGGTSVDLRASAPQQQTKYSKKGP